MPGMTSFGQAICMRRRISVCMCASQADTEGALQVVNWLVTNHVDKLSSQTFPFDLTAMCVAGGPSSLESQPTIARVNNRQIHQGGSVCMPDISPPFSITYHLTDVFFCTRLFVRKIHSSFLLPELLQLLILKCECNIL